MDVAIVKYNAGNIYSVVNAMKRLGITPILTDDAETLRKADRVLFPGQGQAKEAMLYLREHRLDETIKSLTQPVLGICVGQQLLCRHSEEGDVDCIGIFDADVKRFIPQQHQDKVPAMGWNEIYDLSSPLMKDLGENPYTYLCIVTMYHYARRPSLRLTTFSHIVLLCTKTISTLASSTPKRVAK